MEKRRTKALEDIKKTGEGMLEGIKDVAKGVLDFSALSDEAV
jgi:hypothetical protein